MKERYFNLFENNKGLICPFKIIVCQEGWCNECQIYADHREVQSNVSVGTSTKVLCKKVLDNHPESW